MSVLSLKDVAKQRGSGAKALPILRGVNLDVMRSEVVFLEGPSGSGKTTLLSVAAGLVSADSGDVTLDGINLGQLSRADSRRHRARKVGFVFQRSNLLEGLDVADNVLLAATLAGMPEGEARREVDRLLGVLGISALAKRQVNGLSGGEEQRVAVARALVHRPALILADEPTASLDETAGRAIATALAELGRAGEVAVLIATHDPRIAHLATRRVRLEAGRIHEVSAD